MSVLANLPIFTCAFMLLGCSPWWPPAAAATAAAAAAAGTSSCAGQRRGTAHLLRLKGLTLLGLTHYSSSPCLVSFFPLWTLRIPSGNTHIIPTFHLAVIFVAT